MKKVDKVKMIIERNLLREITEYYINGNVPIPYRLLRSAHQAVCARSAYELLGEYEKYPSDVVYKYSICYSKKQGYGLHVDIEKMAEKIWIPAALLGKKSWWRDGFDIFNQDDFNIFSFLNLRGGEDIDDFHLVRKILYCKDSNGIFIAPKLELFLSDKEWRKSAKEYSIRSLKHIKKESYERLSN